MCCCMKHHGEKGIYAWDVQEMLWFPKLTRDVSTQFESSKTSDNLYQLVGGFKHFLFSPLFGEDSHSLTNIFQMDWKHQLVM